jgi:hypothetical protein
MGEALRKRLRQGRFETPVQEAVLNLMVTAGWLDDRLTEALAPHAITPAQYNVLRILRGALPGGYARCEIAERALRRASASPASCHDSASSSTANGRSTFGPRVLPTARSRTPGPRVSPHMVLEDHPGRIGDPARDW